VTEDNSMSQIRIITAHSLRESVDGAKKSNEKIIFEGCCSQRKGDYNVGHILVVFKMASRQSHLILTSIAGQINDRVPASALWSMSDLLLAFSSAVTSENIWLFQTPQENPLPAHNSKFFEN
jgi:hypothetical protein